MKIQACFFILVMCTISLGITLLEVNSSAALDISKVRAINTEVISRFQSSPQAAQLYLDSLIGTVKNDTNNAYCCFYKILKVKINDQITIDQKINIYLDYIVSPSFEAMNEYNRYKIRSQLGVVLLECRSYQAALEQTTLAIQCLESKSDKYNIEIADLYYRTGLIMGNINVFGFEELQIAYQRAQDLYVQIGNSRKSAVSLANLAECALEKKQTEIAIQCCLEAIAEYKKFDPNINYTWATFYPRLLHAYQCSNKSSSVRYVYNQAKLLHEKKMIDDQHYADFCSEVLLSMIAIKDYSEVQKSINYLTSLYKDTCSNRYKYCLINEAKAAMAKVNNSRENEKQALINIIHYSSECGKPNEDFQMRYGNALDRLIQLDRETGNTKDLGIWYEKKIAIESQCEKQHQVYLSCLNSWTKLSEKSTQRKLDDKKKSISALDNYLYFMLVSIIALSVILTVTMYLMNKQSKKYLRESLTFFYYLWEKA